MAGLIMGGGHCGIRWSSRSAARMPLPGAAGLKSLPRRRLRTRPPEARAPAGALVAGDASDVPARSACHWQLIEIHGVSGAVMVIGTLLCAVRGRVAPLTAHDDGRARNARGRARCWWVSWGLRWWRGLRDDRPDEARPGGDAGVAWRPRRGGKKRRSRGARAAARGESAGPGARASAGQETGRRVFLVLPADQAERGREGCATARSVTPEWCSLAGPTRAGSTTATPRPRPHREQPT
jgi:hypothetical protein